VSRAPRVGVVLGGGAYLAHGFSAGALAAVADATGFDPRRADVLVGTSSGAISAALLRAGLAPRDLLAQWTGGEVGAAARAILDRLDPPGAVPPPLAPWTRPAAAPSAPAVLRDAARRPSRVSARAVWFAAMPRGRVPLEPLRRSLHALLGPAWPPGLRVVAVAVDSGRRVVLDEGAGVAPAVAVAASCAMPGWFAPVPLPTPGGDVGHVDGGVHSATNADVLAGAGLDVLVVCSALGLARPGPAGQGQRGRPRSGDPALLVRADHARRLRRELAVVAAAPAPPAVLVLEPSAADLDGVGVNSMAVGASRVLARRAGTAAARALADPGAAPAVARLRAAAYQS